MGLDLAENDLGIGPCLDPMWALFAPTSDGPNLRILSFPYEPCSGPGSGLSTSRVKASRAESGPRVGSACALHGPSQGRRVDARCGRMDRLAGLQHGVEGNGSSSARGGQLRGVSIEG